MAVKIRYILIGNFKSIQCLWYKEVQIVIPTKIFMYIPAENLVPILVILFPILFVWLLKIYILALLNLTMWLLNFGLAPKNLVLWRPGAKFNACMFNVDVYRF